MSPIDIFLINPHLMRQMCKIAPLGLDFVYDFKCFWECEMGDVMCAIDTVYRENIEIIEFAKFSVRDS